jgi:hypothetical protein
MLENYISLFFTFAIFSFLTYTLFDGVKIFKRGIDK